MKYVALNEVGDFKKGDEVPAEQALIWINMYKFPPVEAVEEVVVPIVQEKKKVFKIKPKKRNY